MKSIRLRYWMLIVVAASLGCRPFKAPELEPTTPLLRPLTAGSSQVELEVIFVKLPPGDKATAEDVWQQADEMALPAEQRREASKNGFRAGVLGGPLPSSLEKLLHADRSPPTAELTEAAMSSEEPEEPPGLLPGLDVSKEPKIALHQLYLTPGESGEIVAGEVRDKIQVLYSQEGAARGRSFTEAQPLFATAVSKRRDGSVELALLPEIHYGQFKNQYRGGDGMFRMETTREKISFDKLTLRSPLAPGEILVVGQNEQMPGSLGHHFFTESLSGRPARQLLLIRLREARHDTQFLPEPTAAE